MTFKCPHSTPASKPVIPQSKSFSKHIFPLQENITNPDFKMFSNIHWTTWGKNKNIHTHNIQTQTTKYFSTKYYIDLEKTQCCLMFSKHKIVISANSLY